MAAFEDTEALDLVKGIRVKREHARKEREIAESLAKANSYVNYLAENLDKSINYSEYIAENLDKSINYSEYIAENLDRSISDE